MDLRHLLGPLGPLHTVYSQIDVYRVPLLGGISKSPIARLVGVVLDGTFVGEHGLEIQSISHYSYTYFEGTYPKEFG